MKTIFIKGIFKNKLKKHKKNNFKIYLNLKNKTSTYF